ncbi:hypothetical protein UNDYM_4282 [Undibacterium sp. YM2]|nr:hypothetical protein UNDYM_4282 [Undibacterium sp. YM2]
MAKRSAVAVNTGKPLPMTLLATTVLPTTIIASAKYTYPVNLSDIACLTLYGKVTACQLEMASS